jgi:hypothetical protein
MPPGISVAAVVKKPDPYDATPQDIKGSLNCLRHAVKQPPVVRFVLTLSYGAAFNTVPNPSAVPDATAWNEMAVKMALAPTLYDASRIVAVSEASK